MEDHAEVVGAPHRFQGVSYRGVPWSLEHLDAFAIRLDPGLGFAIDVVVLFSCHCFSIGLDGRDPSAIPRDDLYVEEREKRVLCPERYALSRKYFPQLITQLPNRRIYVASEQQQNFLTIETTDDAHGPGQYLVFFKPEKDSRRQKRVLLRVQSAYVVTALSRREAKARKVGFETMLKAVYENRKIKG